MVAKRHYNETHLVDDYNLLKDAGQIVSNAESLRVSVTSSTAGIAGEKAKRLIAAAAAPPRRIRLSFMPRGMARHMRNTTQLKGATRTRLDSAGLAQTSGPANGRMFFWHLDVYFVGAVIGETTLVKVDSCAEDTPLRHILQAALATLARRAKRRKVNAALPAAAYEQCDADSLAAFIQNEYLVPAADVVDSAMNRFTPLEHDALLHSVLQGRAIIEFPVLYVAKKNSPAALSLQKAAIGIFERPEPDCSSDSDDEQQSSSEEEGEVKDEEKT